MTTRAQLKSGVNLFVGRFFQTIRFYRYKPSAEAAGPYRQRLRQYEDPVEIPCVVSHLQTEDQATRIGNALAHRYNFHTGPDQLIKAFHPLNYDDPRLTFNPGALVTSKDKVVYNDLDLRIVSFEAHGDEGGGPLWYIFLAEEEL